MMGLLNVAVADALRRAYREGLEDAAKVCEREANELRDSIGTLPDVRDQMCFRYGALSADGLAVVIRKLAEREEKEP